MGPILDENIEDKESVRVEKILFILRVCERILSGTMVIGYLFQILHWPYGLLILLSSFVIFFIVQIIKIFFVIEKATAIVKAIAMAVTLFGFYLIYVRYSYAKAVVYTGLILYLSFNFIARKKN